MKTRRLSKTETLGYCHDCHNRAHLEITFAHRDPIRLCDRCGRFLLQNITEVVKPNGWTIRIISPHKNDKNHKQ
jgi:ribosomal protein S27E